MKNIKRKKNEKNEKKNEKNEKNEKKLLTKHDVEDQLWQQKHQVN